MDNFEDQDLGGLPILKKETPSQEKELGGLPILKKKEPTPLGSSGLDSKSLLPKFNKTGVVTTPMGIVETGLEEPKPINVTLKEKAFEKRYYNQPLEKGLIFTDKTKILEPSSRALTGKIQEVPEVDLTKSTQKDLVEKSREQPFVMPSAEEQKSRKEQGYLLNTVSALDRGFYKNLIGNPVKGLGILLQGATSKVLGGSGKGFVSEALVDFGDYFNKTIDELAPQDEEFKNSLTDQFAQAFGQVGSLVLTAGAGGVGKGASMATQLAPKAAGKAAAARGLVAELTSPTSISAGLSMGQAEFEKAKQYGASDEQAFEVFYKNAAVGSVLEKIPTMQFLKRFNQATSGGIANYIKTKGVAGITGGLEEMTTEVLQQLYSNKTAKDVYNINQNIFEDLTSSGGIGFGVGFLLNAMGAKARLLKRDGKTNEAKQIQDQIQQFESKIEEDNKKEQDEKIKVNNIVDKIEKGELIPLDDIEFYEANKNKIDKAIQARQLETELSAPSVIMPEENVAPEIIEPTRPAVIMPEENVPVETTVVRPQQQGKAPSVIMPEANVAPEVAETVVTEEVKPTEAKPEIKSKLQDYKQKFSSIDLLKNPTKESIDKFIEGYDFNKGKMSYENIQEAPSGLSDQEVKKFNVENSTNPKELVEIYLSEPKESKLSAKEEVIAEGLSKVTLSSFKRFGDKNLITGGMARTYFNKGAKGIDVRAQELSKELDIQPKDIVDFMVKYPSGASAALRSGESDVAYAAAMKFQDLTGLRMSDRVAKKISDKDKAPKKKTEIEFDEEEVPTQFEGGFVPFEEDMDIEGMEEPPFAVEEATTEEVAQMQDIVKDYIDEGTTSLSEIKKAIAKELGYNTKKLRQTIDDAYNKYTATKAAAPAEVTSGVIGRIGNALKKMFGKDAQKPFIAKDSKALEAKLKDIREDVRFQIEAGFRGTNNMPVAYRYDTDKVARERFDIPKLKKIGEGSDRVVFDLKDGKVLKVAKTPRGLEQNIYEGDYYLTGTILPETFERGLNYVVVEKISPAITRTIDLGIADINIESDKKGIGKLNDLLKKLKQFTQKDFDNHNGDLQDILAEYDLTDIMNYDVIWNDFTAKRNWGLKDGEPLHLDGGTFGGIQMLDRFKGQKPLSDPEFRDIYNKSKKAKIENKDVDKFTKFMANDAESDFTADDIKKYKTLAGFEKYGSRYKTVTLSEMGVDKSITNAKQFADKLAEADGPFKGILKAIAKTPGLDKVRFEIVDGYIINDMGSAAGTYGPDPENLATWVWENNGKLLRVGDTKENTYYTGTHELMHWVTIDSIMADTKSQDYKALEKIYTFIRSNDKFKDLTTDNMWGKSYGLFNFKEFMAEILINPEFRENIGEITAANKEEFLKGFEKGSNFGKDFDEYGLGIAIYNAIARAIEKMLGTYGGRIDFDKSLMDNAVDLSIKTFLKSGNTPSKINFMADENAEIIGFTYNNRMYLNGSALNPNTPIHEAGHIWVEWTKTNDPKIYAKGMELVKNSPYFKKAKESKFYQKQANNLPENQREDYYSNEALAMAIGDKGAQFVVESKKESFKDWLKTLWTKIKSLTGFKDLTEEEFQNLTFEEFSKMAVKEILGVENDLDQFQAARSIKKKKEFVKGKVRGEANKRAIDDFEVDDMIKLIKADYDLQTLKNIKDAIQKRSAEEVLPSQPRKIGERRGERKRVEPRVEGEDVTGEGEATPTEDVEKEWQGAITIAANEERRQMLGLPEYQREKQSFEEWTNKAIKMIKRGYNVEKLLDKIEKGYSPSPEENQIRKIYVAKLKSDYDANPTPELEKKLIRYTQLNDIVNSQLGRQLRSLADVTEPRETLADFVISKMEANNVDELTEKQRKQVEKQYEEIKKKEVDVEAKLEINDELNTQLLAETVFKEEKAKRKPYQKTKDYKADRKSIIDSIKQKWKDKDKPTDVLMALPFPVPTKKAQQLVAIAPDVSKLMASYIEEGVDDLKEIVSRIYVDLRNEIDGLSEKDIFDVIAGRYKKEKPLLTQLQLKKAELKKEAELIAKIEDIMAGNMPTNEKAKIEQNQRITQLRNELRDLKKEVGFYDLSKINSLKEKNLEKIKEIDEKIQKGDFEKAIKAPSFLENPEFRKKYPKEYEAYIQSAKELSDKKHEFEVSLAKDELKGLTFRDKLVKRWGPEFKNTLSAIKATLDNSFIFIQLGPAIWSNPLLLPKVLNEQRKVIFNEGRFKREIVQIFENKELANLIEVSGLDILDPQTLRESLREEQLGGTDFLERSVEIKGKKYSLATIIKAPFERIAIAAGNYVRLKLFLESVSHLEAQGKTIETHEKEFKDAARIANEMTARGELAEEFKTGKLKTLSSLTWAPKMIGSTINLLGLGDIYNYALGRKGYYASLSPELRKAAIGKMATAIAVPYLAMAALALDDDFEVDYDPRSVTFGQIKQISTGKSWNPYGRFTSVVRYLILMMLGVRYIGDEKLRADFKTETFKFFRGKMAPAYGLGLDLAFREGFDGQPLSFNDVAKDAITPLAIKDLKTYLEDDGTWGLITQGLPALSGIKVGTEKQYNQAKQPLEDIIKKHARTDDTYYSFELKNPSTKEIATKEQFDKFVKERDKLIAEKLTDLYNGYVITDSPNPVPFVSLEPNEAGKQISTAKTEATKEAKEIVFGKKKKTAMERLIERKRRMLRR